MRSLDRGGYPTVGQLTGESGWSEDLRTEELADVLRSSLRAGYADASDEELRGALENVFDAMSPAEAFNFGSALSKVGKGASRLVADPTFREIVRTAAPIAGGALGTFIGGPVGTALGTQLGNLAASALPVPPAPPSPPPPAPSPPVTAVAPASAAPVPSAPTPAPGVPAPVATIASSAAPAPLDTPSAPGPSSPVAGGSAAAAQGLVLTQQPEVLRALLAAALGQHGRKQVSGIPVGQLLALLSQVFAQAAADADELMYLDQQADATESVLDEVPIGSIRSLYLDLLGADNLEFAEAVGAESFELAEAAEWEGLYS
jgi:hypothetical protein